MEKLKEAILELIDYELNLSTVIKMVKDIYRHNKYIENNTDEKTKTKTTTRKKNDV